MMYHIATGRSRTETTWRNQDCTWEQLTGKLAQTKRTPETVEAYRAMSKEQRGRLKDVGGFVGGHIGTKAEDGSVTEGRRTAQTVIDRSLLTLDIDYGTDDTIGLVRDALAGTDWCLYSTHSHTPEKPRYRLIIPLSRDVTPDEYVPVARKVAADIGIDVFDDSTYEPHRLMYWPSTPKDGEYVFKQGFGHPLDADKVLASYKDWRNVTEWPVSSRLTRALERRGTKAEDPTAKGGVIGAFCRAYTISEAMDAFLPGVYKPAGKDRYTYAAGSTAGGAVVYDDKWLYSHHGTDPCCEREVNAFDLVRIHLFGDLDAGAAPETPVNRLPSFKAMGDLVMADGKASGQMALDKAAEIEADFGSVLPGDDKEWMKGIKTDKKGYIPSVANFYYIFTHDPVLLAGDVRRNIFTGSYEVFGALPWKRDDTPKWCESDLSGLVLYMSERYRFDGYKTQMVDAWDQATQSRQFHPVRDYLNGLPEWDGVKRLDTLLIDYLGAVDDPDGLTRAMTRKHLTAAVARVMTPGVKYDYVLTLVGPEGIGKSSLVRALGGRWFSDSFTAANLGDKESMAQLRSAWIFELAELKDYKRSEIESFKSFISKQEDTFRAAYARVTETHPRQCVFFATTNEDSFLRGDTGNRRFWPVEVGVNKATKDVFSLDKDPDTVGQIWAEALRRFREGEKLFLPQDLEMLARARQSEHSVVSSDDRRGIIEAFIRKEVPAGWWGMNRSARREYFRDKGEGVMSATMRRDTICVMEIQEECFGVTNYDRYKAREISQILSGIRGLEPMGPTRVAYYENGDEKSDPEYGLQRRFRISRDFWGTVTDPVTDLLQTAICNRGLCYRPLSVTTQ